MGCKDMKAETDGSDTAQMISKSLTCSLGKYFQRVVDLAGNICRQKAGAFLMSCMCMVGVESLG